MSVIVGLDDALDASVYGGKAAQLARARRAGLPVADGFAVPAALVGRVTGGDERAIAQVAGVYDGFGGAVAVRSSAVGEDAERASYAGQHLTVLNVCGREQLLGAVRDVARSGASDGAREYRRRLGEDGTPRMAVVVQRLVAADVAGVLFTRDPATGADDFLIEAAWGLGDVVVAGRVIPDRYRLSRAGAVIAREAGDKHVAVRSRPEGGTTETPVAAEDARALCLSDGQLATLHDLGHRCEAVFGTAQDVEWAFAGTILVLLQSRPITR